MKKDTTAPDTNTLLDNFKNSSTNTNIKEMLRIKDLSSQSKQNEQAKTEEMFRQSGTKFKVEPFKKDINDSLVNTSTTGDGMNKKMYLIRVLTCQPVFVLLQPGTRL